MSLDTRTERRQARHRRTLVVGAVVALASVLSVALIVAFLTGGTEQPPSADSPQNASSSGWTPTGDDVWSDAASPTSVPTSTVSSTTATGTPAAGATGAANPTAVTVGRTAGGAQPAGSTTPKPTATTSTTTELPPGQLKRPKPKNTTPPPRR